MFECVHRYIRMYTYMRVHSDIQGSFFTICVYMHVCKHRYQHTQAVSEATFIDLFLLSDCDALVGTFGSHFSKLAYELMVAKKGDFMPYVSMDRPWQPIWPIRANHDEHA